MKLSLILPCYNPPEGWVDNILARYKALRNDIGDETELIIVIDGTGPHVKDTDLRRLEASLQELKLLRYEKNMGKGYAIRQGAGIARGKVILYTDIDFPYDHESILAVYDALRSGSCDVAVGVKNEQYYAQVPFVRRKISRASQGLVRIFLPMPVTDTQCGLKGFQRSARPVFLATTIHRYLFDLEFVHRCYQQGLSVRAVPVQLRAGISFRKMSYSVLFTELFNFSKLLFRRTKG